MNSKILEIRMLEKTLQQVKELKENIHAPGLSDTIRRAIEIADAISKDLKNGDKIIVESKNGRRKSITIPGLNQQ